MSENKEFEEKRERDKMIGMICGSPVLAAKVLVKLYRSQFDSLKYFELVEVQRLVKDGFVKIELTKEGDKLAEMTIDIFPKLEKEK